MITQREGSRYSFVDSSQPKVFRVPGLGVHPAGGLIGYFGNAVVGATAMSDWLPDVVAEFGHSLDTTPFPQFLVDHLEADARVRQLRSFQGFHVGAFERRSGHRVPVFWFVRNAQIDEATCQHHTLPGCQFRSEEQLLSRAYVPLRPRG